MDNADVLKLLINAGADLDKINIDGKTAAFIAAENGCNEVLKLLIDKKAYSNDANGNTLLISAGIYGSGKNENQATIELLLKSGFDINAQNNDGVSVLINATRCANYDVIEYLIKHGANINVQTKSGLTPLILASIDNRSEVVSLFLKEKAILNTMMKNGNTALMLAIINNNQDIAKLLIDNGADVNIKNTLGKSAIQIARREKLTNIVLALKAKNADDPEVVLSLPL
jgi:ankyrin repeat protein